MKKILLILFVSFYYLNLTAQLNVSFVGSLNYDEDLNDIWGYKAPDGTEYALVGVANGFSIVSLADPSNPTQVDFIPGDETMWRDVKTFGTFAYVTTDQSNDGLLVVDMSDLPNSTSSYFYTPPLLNQGNLAQCHNIYIDEVGYMYLAGCNVNNGAVLIFDVFTDQNNPIFINNVPGSYAHDVFVKDNVLYSSNLTNGLRIFDVTDKNNIQLQAIQETPLDFTHNAWATDDNHYVFTTDERANAPVAAYDVSDLDDVKELDQYKPSTTLGEGVIPHNAHVWQNYVIVSYYSDGCIILDATYPDNLIEVGNFDTYIPSATGFNGAWGAYPYLPSGLILVADIQSGLYVLQPNYVQGCYLEGLVTDITNGNSLNNVEIEIISGAPNLDFTNNQGTYKTGQANAGTFDVVFKKLGYKTVTAPAVFVNGEITILDVQMTPAQSIDLEGITLRSADGSLLDDVGVVAVYEHGNIYTTISNDDGAFTLNNVFEGEYRFYVGKWGYFHETEFLVFDPTNNTITLSLSKGYQDDFFFDFDWTVSGDANAGIWEMDEPEGTYFGELASNTNKDIAGDLGDQCYVTGNDGSSAAVDDVDGGFTKLSSPVMDLTTYNQPIIRYRSWFFNNGGGGSDPNDDLIITISNGTTEVTLETVTESISDWRPESEFIVSDFIEITDNMQFHMQAQDSNPGHLVEAALDAFIVVDGMPSSTANLLEENIQFEVYPNPFDQNIIVELDFDQNQNLSNAQLQVFNLLGQNIDFLTLKNNMTKVELGENWESGIYFLNLIVDNKTVHTLRVVKQ